MTPLVSTALLRTQSDARLVALAAQGHERAFEAIVERYRRPLHRFCRRVLPEARAEDAVQQTFLKAWTALGAGTEVEDLRAWLYRIARNAALDSAKKAGYDYDELTESLRMAPGVDEDLERRAVIRETLTGVAALPDNQREALLRTAVDGESRAAIARDLDVSEGAVRQLVHRARTTLRAAATALTPLPLASWAAAFEGTPAGEVPQRIAELAAGAGSAGGAGALLKAGTAVVAAGVLAVGPPGTALRHAVEPDRAGAGDAQAAPGHGEPGQRGEHAHRQAGSRARHGEARGRRGGSRRSSGTGPRGSSATGDDRSTTSGSGETRSGSGSLDQSGSGSGSSGSGSSGSGSSGSGSSGSGSSGSGSSGSGSGSGDNSGPGSTSSGGDNSGEGSTSSGEGSSGSGSSGSGDSGSDSSGSGSGDVLESSSSGSGSGDDRLTSGSDGD